MKKLLDGRYVVGFDNGYQLCKTANYIFDNGVHSLGGVEPSLVENSLFYSGDYYKIEGRAAITDDKISDQNAFLLTLAGIAKELKREGTTNAKIVLAVGLPFSEYGRMKKELIAYYMKIPEVEYGFEGVTYHIIIDKVYCFPQCYSAMASRLGNMKEDWILIDIGSKTTDVVYVQDGVPFESKSITIEKAMIKWIKEIQAAIQVRLGKDIEEKEILKVALGKTSYLPLEYIELIKSKLKEQIIGLELELAERGYDLKYKRVIYAGGGAVIVKNHMEGIRSNVAYEDDIRANAI